MKPETRRHAFRVKHLLLALCLVWIPLAAPAQNIRLDYQNTPLITVLGAIQNQSGYKFVYNNSLVDVNQRVSVYTSGEKIEAVLDKALRGTGIEWKIIDKQIALSPADVRQARQERGVTVRGRVTDQDGEPVVGAAVQNLADRTYAITDLDGNYAIEVKNPAAATLEFSSLSMETVTQPLNGRSRIDIQLTPDKVLLDEVVVTGYQTISKERATGSFDRVEAGHIAQPTANVGERLIGTAAGLAATTDVNGDVSFQIRGLTTLVASNKDPLLIVDGFPVEASINTLNPNTIESITILKDAAAASIWGAKAANGVIVVVTRNGKGVSSRQGGVQVTFNTMLKYSPKIDNGYWTANASNEEVIDWQIYSFQNKNFGYQALVADSNGNSNIRYNYNSYSNLYVMLNENRLGYVSDSELQSYIARIRTQSNKQEIKDYLLANPFARQYNLNIAHGSERITSNVSLLYEKGQRYLKGNSYDKYTFNSNMAVKIYKWLDFNVNGSFYYNVAHNNGVPFKGPEFENLFDASGNYADVIRSYDSINDRYFYTPNIHRYFNWTAFPYQDWGYNPVQEMRGRDYTTKTLDARIQAGLNFKLAEGISFESKFQYEMLNEDVRNIDDETTWYVRSTINIAAAHDKTPTGSVTPNLPSGSILRQNRSYLSSYDWRNQFNFDRTFADRHQVTFIAGAEISDRVLQGVTNPITYGYDDETLAVGKFLGSSFTYRNYFNSNSTFTSYVNSYSYTHDRYFSAYANIAYSFDGKYTLSASARTDASNFITDDPRYRYAPFWSVGGKWIVSREEFAKDASWIDYLALRLTYGYNGNVDRSTSVQPVLTYNTSQDVLISDYTATFKSYGNTSLRWERTGTLDFGIDFDLLGGKLSGKLDVYNKKGRDLLATINLPSATGAATNKINAAEMTNRGFELELGSRQRIGNVRWQGSLMLAYNYNRIDKMTHTAYTGYDLSGRNEEDSGSSADVRYRAGYNANTLWSYAYGGLVNTGTESSPAYYPSIVQDGQKVPLVQTQTGDWSAWMVNSGVAVAPWNVSLSNTFSYGNFDLSFMLTGKFGHKFRRLMFNYTLMPKALPNLDLAEVISQEGDKYIPFAYAPYSNYTYASGVASDMNWWTRYTRFMDYGVESATHFRLQEVTFGYRLPVSVVKRIGIGGLSFYLKGNNLAILTFNKYHEDPEFPLGNVRPVASGTLGINFTF